MNIITKNGFPIRTTTNVFLGNVISISHHGVQQFLSKARKLSGVSCSNSMKKDLDIFSLLMSEGCQFYEEIGTSPLGTLYRLEHPRFGSCALKYFHGAFIENADSLKKTLSSIEKWMTFEHPNVGKVYQWEVGAETYILRELVLGTSLEQYLKMKQKIAYIEATKIILDVAMAFLAAYPFGIVCKNCKPGNIILLPENRASLVDICLPPTNPHYIAPEQWEGKKSDIRSDIYGLGVIYYEMLAGTPPFSGKNQIEIRRAHISQDPSWKLEAPQEIIDVISKMLSKNPEQRYNSPFPLIGTLREFLKNLGVEVKPAIASLNSKTKEISKKKEELEKISQEEKEMPLKKKNHTTMMVALQKTQEMVANLPEKSLKKREFQPTFLPQQESERLVEEIYLTKQEMQENLNLALEKMTYIEKIRKRERPLPTRVVYFPKEFEKEVIAHLNRQFRTESWLLKASESQEEMEVEIDLEQAYILLHFYRYEDQLQAALQDKTSSKECILAEEEQHTGQTVELSEEDVVYVTDEGEEVVKLREERGKMSTIELKEEGVETINDITIHTAVSSLPSSARNSSVENLKTKLRNSHIEILVDFDNAYETMGWVKFVRKHNLKKGEHFTPKQEEESSSIKKFIIHLDKLEAYQKEKQHIARIKEFFQGDYDITELDQGGMGVVLKLTAKNDPTILSLRPENYWARQRFSPYLHIRKDKRGKEIIYAELPKGMEFVVKVAFGGHEESLIQEAQILSKIAEDPHICHTIIGAVQQGRLFSLNEGENQTQFGYYVMLEYAPRGNAEQLYRSFPERRLTCTVAFALMYGMVRTLCKLKELGIIHRDIKPQNILLDENGIPKLSDFGLAIVTSSQSGQLTEERKRLLRILDQEFLHISTKKEQAELRIVELKEKETKKQELSPEEIQNIQAEIVLLQKEIQKCQEQEQERAAALQDKYRLLSAEENALRGKFAGSIYYAAPEQLHPEAILTPKCDVYQLGASMFTLLTGKKPVDGNSILDVMSKILYPVKPTVSDFIKGSPVVDALSKLIEKMMDVNPETRIDILEVREQLNLIFFEHVLSLKEIPQFPRPSNLKSKAEIERWEHKVAFSQDLHKKCLHTIFSTVFQDQKLPELRKDVDKIVFQCPRCGKKLHVYRHMDRKKGNCPHCGKRILVLLELPEEKRKT